MQGVPGGQGRVDVPVYGGEADHLYLRRLQRDEDRHGVVDAGVGVDDDLLLRSGHVFR